MIPPDRYDYIDGLLRVPEKDGFKIYARPCDWAADCGPEAFLGGPRDWTPAAREALKAAAERPFRPLRGMPDDFIVFAAGLRGRTVSVCGMACSATTLTVRFEDVWSRIPASLRAVSYSCAATRDPNAKDGPQAADGVVRETLQGLAPDVRICLDLGDGGGFRLAFEASP